MKADKLYRQMEKDFITPVMDDDWAKYMTEIQEYISDNFIRRSMGLVCDFTERIDKVYTAVFPSNAVMKHILADNVNNAMLFVHHPSIWDIRKAPNVFQQMNTKLLQQFKDRNISIYNLHVPLDNYGIYSTSSTLANALRITQHKPFGPYHGGMCGVFGKTAYTQVSDLKTCFEKALGHKVSLYNYGNNKIVDGRVAIVAGGGNDTDILEEIVKSGINTFVTGITAKSKHSSKAHAFAKKHKINILGGTHYSTEQFACKAMVDYFKKLSLPSEFIKDKPVMEDM